MSTSKTLTTDFTIQLRDGRAMGVAVVGKSDGFPIFHCHGSGSSRLEVNLLAAEATAQGVRLIGLDRPGIGRSDAKAGYQLLYASSEKLRSESRHPAAWHRTSEMFFRGDSANSVWKHLEWPDDVGEVADQLGIEQFAIEGLSAGAPYAMACAYKMPHRLTACGLISTVSPGNLIRRAGSGWMRAMWWMGEQFPWFLRFYVPLVQRATGSDEASLEKYLVRYSARLGPADHKLLGMPEIRKQIAQAMAESYRQGGEANLEAALAEIQPWGFQVEQITFEKILLWHGEQDRIMPVAPVRLLAQALPHCTATFYPDEGHFSTMANHVQDIFSALRV